jgi:opacity protein-like surface antigen
MKLTHGLLVSMIFCGANLMAQSNDMGFLFGFSQRNASIRNDVIQGEVRLSLQVNPARLLIKGERAGRLYAEVPIMTAAGLNGKIDDNVSGRLGAVVFVTPGLRYQINLTPRLSFYFGGGFGFAAARQRIGVPSGQQIVTTKETYWSEAGNYGGGVDFRFTEHWSLRAEARDFRARKETKVPGRNTGVLVGFAFRF